MSTPGTLGLPFQKLGLATVLTSLLEYPLAASMKGPGPTGLAMVPVARLLTPTELISEAGIMSWLPRIEYSLVNSALAKERVTTLPATVGAADCFGIPKALAAELVKTASKLAWTSAAPKAVPSLFLTPERTVMFSWVPALFQL